MTALPLDKIKVNGRHRQNLGDLDGLAASIRQVGLLHPVVVTEGGDLIAGQRRLEAVRLLDWDEVPVTVVQGMTEARQLLWAERDENTCRLKMSPSEKVALGRELEKLERPKAAERKAATQAQPGEGRVGKEKVSSPEVPAPTGKTAEIVGDALGMSRPTYNRAKALVVAAEAGREGAAEAVEDMDRTGNVTGPYKRIFPGLPKGAPRGGQSPELSTRGREISEAAARRISKLCAGLDGWAMGLADFDVNRALQTAEPEQVEEWIESISHGISALRQLRTNLQGES